jgi:hypothetical protein
LAVESACGEELVVASDLGPTVLPVSRVVAEFARQPFRPANLAGRPTRLNSPIPTAGLAGLSRDLLLRVNPYIGLSS